MTTATLTLTEFLLARIAEREMVAHDMQHQAGLGRPFFDVDRLAGGTGVRELINPARVLAECAAKRQIVARHEGWHVCPSGNGLGYTDYGDGTGDEWESVCPTLCDLTAVDADHPEYRQEWRP